MRSANSVAATADTVPALSDIGFGARLVSALVLIPVALAAVALGWPFFDLLVLAVGMLMAWEWVRLCSAGRLPTAGLVAIAATGAAVVASSFLDIRNVLLIVAAGAVLAAVVAGLLRDPIRLGPLWLGTGVLYAALPCAAVLWLRADPAHGLATILWLFALVWAIDSGAYLVGRRVGGPKLAPRISPKKTWSGLGGGVIAGFAAGGIAGMLIDGAAPLVLAAVSAVLAVVEQAGDLGESALKRRFGAKDSSGIIPGHGGVLDRIDGLVAVVVVVALLSAASGGSIVTWQ
jgi:phosphatidate cytidylyltransferase